VTKITLAICNVYKNGGRFVVHRKKKPKKVGNTSFLKKMNQINGNLEQNG